MNRPNALVLVGALTLCFASAAPLDDGTEYDYDSSGNADCQWSGLLNCGTANADCLAFEPPRVKCEPSSIGDPDGDGCGCWVPVSDSDEL